MCEKPKFVLNELMISIIVLKSDLFVWTVANDGLSIMPRSW